MHLKVLLAMVNSSGIEDEREWEEAGNVFLVVIKPLGVARCHASHPISSLCTLEVGTHAKLSSADGQPCYSSE